MGTTWYIENKPEAELYDHMQRYPELFQVEMDYHDPRGYTALHVAAKKGSVPLTRRLIEMGAKVDDVDRTKCSPLHFAAATGHADVVALLVERGRANVNVSSNDGSTPLHYAALFGFASIAQYLLHHGADPFAQTDLKSTPLHYACSSGHVQVARVLLAHADGAGRRALAVRDVNQSVPFSHFALVDENAAVARARVVSNCGSGLSRDMLVLLESGDLCDVELVCKDSSPLRAHRSVLHARAPELLATISGVPGRIELANVTAETAATFLHWLYSNEISQADMRWDAFRTLLDLGMHFQLQRLLVWLEVVMERNLDVVSLPHLVTFLVPHASTFPSLARAMGRFLVSQASFFFTDDKRAFALSLPALDLLLAHLALQPFAEPIKAPPLTSFPPGYEIPTWLEDALSSRRPAPAIAPVPAALARPGFSDVEKEQLLLRLGVLSDNEQCMDEVSRVVSDPKYASQSNAPEVEIDLNSLPLEALLELKTIVRKYLPAGI